MTALRRRSRRTAPTLALLCAFFGGVLTGAPSAAADPGGAAGSTDDSRPDHIPLTALAPMARAACVVPSRADTPVIRTVYEVGQAKNVSAKVMLAMFEAGWVESHMNNLNCGHARSLGVFQIQSPMHGTAAQVRDVVWSTNWFIRTALPLERSSATAGDLAANVERPRADLRWRYGAAESIAKQLMDQARSPYGAIGRRHAALGGSTGTVGRPVRAEEAGSGGGRLHEFRNGTILWSSKSGANWVHGGILAAYRQQGREASLGYPTTEELRDGNGRLQRFQKGAIRWSGGKAVVTRT